MANRWSVLTPIMLEHPGNLGPTLLDIAANKMAVIKSGQELCVSYDQAPEVVDLLKSMCRRFGVPLKLAGEDFQVEVLETGPAGSKFSYRSQRRQGIFTAARAFQAIRGWPGPGEEIVPDSSDLFSRPVWTPCAGRGAVTAAGGLLINGRGHQRSICRLPAGIAAANRRPCI